MQGEGTIPTVECHGSSVRFGERRFDDLKKGFSHGSVVNLSWLPMKRVAACLLLIMKRSQQILRLVSHDATAHHVGQDIERAIVDGPMGSKGFVQIDESPIAKHTELNVVPDYFPKDRFIDHIRHARNRTIVHAHNEIRSQFHVVMLIPRVCKPFHFQGQGLVEFDDRSAILPVARHCCR